MINNKTDKEEIFIMKKRSLAVLMAGVMAASMMTGVVSVYADADSKTLTVGFDLSLIHI